MTPAPATAGSRKLNTVRTVLGDIPMEQLGRCDYHEHLFQASPLLVGDELDDEQASTQEAESLRQAGIDAFVDATPTGLGRNPGAVAPISHSTGIAVVHVSGAHHQGHYGSTHWLLEADEDDLVHRFLADVRDEMPVEDGPNRGDLAVGPTGDHVRAGMLKAGIGYWRISPFERRILAAVTAAARLTGVAAIIDCLERVVATGDASRLVLGGDVARRTQYLAYGGMPGLKYLPRRFLPRLRDRLGPDVVDQLLIDNPARLLTQRAAQPA